MKRDMDLIRKLLIQVEGGQRSFQTLDKETAEILGADPGEALSKEETANLAHHLDLLQDAGFVEFTRASGGIWIVTRMTWKGHEFIDSVRDGEVWKWVKQGGAKIGNASVALMWELAKAYGKKLAAEQLHIELP